MDSPSLSLEACVRENPFWGACENNSGPPEPRLTTPAYYFNGRAFYITAKGGNDRRYYN